MEILILLFALAGSVWLLPVISRGKVIHVTMVMLLSGTVVGPSFYAVDGPIQISVDRVIWLAMLGLALIQWRRGYLKIPKPTRVDCMFIALAGLVLYSVLKTDPVAKESPPLARWVFYIAMPLGTYVVMRCVKFSKEDLRFFSFALLGLGTYLALTGICEVKGWYGAVFPKYIVDEENWVFLGRARGPLLNPIVNGILMSIAAIVAINEFFRSGRRGKLIFSVLFVITVVGVYATLTRSCWLGIAGACGFIFFVHALRWVRVLGLVCAVLMVAALAAGLKDQVLALERDKALSAADAAKSVELRPLLAVVAYEMIKDKPIAGHGFGGYLRTSQPFHETRAYDLPLETVRIYQQHNTFLSLAVDTGLPGLLLLSIPLVILFFTGLTMARTNHKCGDSRRMGILMMSTVIVYFANGMFHDLLIIPMMQMFVMTIAGVCINVRINGVVSQTDCAFRLPARMIPAARDSPELANAHAT